MNSTTALSDVELCLLTEVDLHHGKSEEVPNKMLAKPLVSRCGLAKQFFKLFPEGPDIGFGMYVGWIWNVPSFGCDSLCNIVVIPLPLVGHIRINLCGNVLKHPTVVQMVLEYLNGVKVTKCIVRLHPVVGLGLAKGRHPFREFL